jgi:hypothetical protein
VRDFARRAILSAVEDVDYMGIGEAFGEDESWPQGDGLAYDAMHDAVYDAVGAATVTVSWRDEQPQDTAAPYRPIPYEDEFISIIQSGSFYAEVTAFRRLAATIGVEQTYRKWTKLQRRARAETAQPQDDGDVRAVAALAAADDDEQLDRAVSELIARFADRIAALEARDAMGTDAAQNGRSATETDATPPEAAGVELEFGKGTAGLSEAEALSDCPSPYRDGTCRHLTCGRCKQHTNNSSQGHYWAYCKVTKTKREFHFCCPGDCELERNDETGTERG